MLRPMISIAMKQQISDDFVPVRNRQARDMILQDIAKHGVEESMLLYGMLIGKCGHCGRTLTNDESRALGIGPAGSLMAAGVIEDNLMLVDPAVFEAYLNERPDDAFALSQLERLSTDFSLWAEAIGAPPHEMVAWRGIDLRAELATRLPYPVYLQNDATAAAYGNGSYRIASISYPVTATGAGPFYHVSFQYSARPVAGINSIWRYVSSSTWWRSRTRAASRPGPSRSPRHLRRSSLSALPPPAPGRGRGRRGRRRRTTPCRGFHNSWDALFDVRCGGGCC